MDITKKNIQPSPLPSGEKMVRQMNVFFFFCSEPGMARNAGAIIFKNLNFR
jgi:hypothetical protein